MFLFKIKKCFYRWVRFILLVSRVVGQFSLGTCGEENNSRPLNLSACSASYIHHIVDKEFSQVVWVTASGQCLISWLSLGSLLLQAALIF